MALCDDRTMADDDPLKRFLELAFEAYDLRNFDCNKCRALRGPLTRKGFINIHLQKKKIPIGTWARDRTMRLIGLYLKTVVLDIIPALANKPFEDLGISRLESEVWCATVREALEDDSVHRYMNVYFWVAQKPPNAST